MKNNSYTCAALVFSACAVVAGTAVAAYPWIDYHANISEVNLLVNGMESTSFAPGDDIELEVTATANCVDTLEVFELYVAIVDDQFNVVSDNVAIQIVPNFTAISFDQRCGTMVPRMDARKSYSGYWSVSGPGIDGRGFERFETGTRILFPEVMPVGMQIPGAP